MRLLLVEDEDLIGSALRLGLTEHGYTVDWVKDGRTALNVLLAQTDKNHFDAVILDLNLPKVLGHDILKTVRDKGVKTPIIVLTAFDTLEDRVRGFNLGADDYLNKPFDLGELCARIRAVIKRGSGKPRAIPTISAGDITLDPATHSAYRNGEIIDLSRREFVLLHLLMENVNKVMSREQIVQNIYGWGDDIDSNALEVHVHNIRKKIKSLIIKTVRGVGYMVEDPNKLPHDTESEKKKK